MSSQNATLYSNQIQTSMGIYSSAIGFLNGILGFDPAPILNVCFLIAACSTLFHYTREFAYHIGRTCWISSTEIQGLDPVYVYLMRWMTVHQVTEKSKTIKATAIPQNSEEDYQSIPDVEDNLPKGSLINERQGGGQIVNYRHLVNSVPIRFLLAGQHSFWHKGNFFTFRHSTLAMVPGTQETFLDERYYISLDCWVRSLKPVRDLLQEAQTEFFESSGSGTKIMRPAVGQGGQFHWTQVSLVDDINEYLLPTTRKWYANHGIPYRRGYLFSGAPGIGKTSLASALAGVFGLDIYFVSLTDPDLTEAELSLLFSTLPQRCITLLEDIDAAGLKRTSVTGPDESSTVRFGRAGQGSNPHRSISLSGLLNVIDGVSSQEDRVLIMTTNSPRALDSALIRPGRVDMHVSFDLATRNEIRALFLIMYDEYHPDLAISRPRGGEEEKPALVNLADAFSEMLPPNRLSPAAIQGHLLRHKCDPHNAVLSARN
ncbi:hypothetical protein MMC13_004154 [Lambiella insularis]|nr:hypothetical protein [Lambiella insularis]